MLDQETPLNSYSYLPLPKDNIKCFDSRLALLVLEFTKVFGEDYAILSYS